jgi:two-component system, OmpR family, response regulator
MRVLVVEDDAETAEFIARAARSSGMAAEIAGDLAEASWHLEQGLFDVLVLDVMLPDGDGLAFCRELRAAGRPTPILFLSARGTVAARVDGLSAGGDDYLVKPFAVRELVARLRALGRRGAIARPQHLVLGPTSLDLQARRAERAGVEVPITAREWQVLEVLLSRAGRTVAYDDVLEAAWGDVSERARASLEVIVARLRKKLDPSGAQSAIHTVRSLGYRLDLP